MKFISVSDQQLERFIKLFKQDFTAVTIVEGDSDEIWHTLKENDTTQKDFGLLFKSTTKKLSSNNDKLICLLPDIYSFLLWHLNVGTPKSADLGQFKSISAKWFEIAVRTYKLVMSHREQILFSVGDDLTHALILGNKDVTDIKNEEHNFKTIFSIILNNDSDFASVLDLNRKMLAMSDLTAEHAITPEKEDANSMLRVFSGYAGLIDRAKQTESELKETMHKEKLAAGIAEELEMKCNALSKKELELINETKRIQKAHLMVNSENKKLSALLDKNRTKLIELSEQHAAQNSQEKMLLKNKEIEFLKQRICQLQGELEHFYVKSLGITGEVAVSGDSFESACRDNSIALVTRLINQKRNC